MRGLKNTLHGLGTAFCGIRAALVPCDAVGASGPEGLAPSTEHYSFRPSANWSEKISDKRTDDSKKLGCLPAFGPLSKYDLVLGHVTGYAPCTSAKRRP